MVFAYLILPAMLAATPAAPPKAADLCPKPAVTAESATFRRLGELPPAQATLAVFRSSHCPVPVIHARDRLAPVPRARN